MAVDINLLDMFLSILVLAFGIFSIVAGAFTAYFGTGRSRSIGGALMVLGVIGFMKPALGVRFTAGLAAFLAVGFLAGAAAFFTAGFFAAGFLVAGFFVVAILGSPILGLHLNRFRKHSSEYTLTLHKTLD